MARELSKKAEKWIEEHTRKQVEKDVTAWRKGNDNLSDLAEAEYKADREEYWREEFYKEYLDKYGWQ